MAAINHLEGKSGYTVELLQTLTDEQLAEQIEWYQDRRNWYANHPDETKPESIYKSHSYASYHYSVSVARAESERARRH